MSLSIPGPFDQTAGVSVSALELAFSTGEIYAGAAIGTGIVAEGSNLVISVDTPATISNLPYLWYGMHFPLKDIMGNAITIDGVDLVSPILMAEPPPAIADLVMGIVLYDDSVDPGGPPTITSKGWGGGLSYSSGSWLVSAFRSAGTWNKRDALSVNVNTSGVIAQRALRATSGANNLSATALNGSGALIAGANEGTVDDTANVGEGINRVAVGIGWMTGIGGPSTASIRLHAAVAAFKFLSLPNVLP